MNKSLGLLREQALALARRGEAAGRAAWSNRDRLLAGTPPETRPVVLWGGGALLAVLAGLGLAVTADGATPEVETRLAVAAVAAPAPAPPAPPVEGDRTDVVGLLDAYRTEAASLLDIANDLRRENDNLRRRLTAMESEISGLNANTVLKGRLDQVDRSLATMEAQVSAARVAADAATAAAVDMTRVAAIPAPEPVEAPVPRPAPERETAAPEPAPLEAATPVVAEAPPAARIEAPAAAAVPAAPAPDLPDAASLIAGFPGAELGGIEPDGGIDGPTAPTDPLVTAAIAPDAPVLPGGADAGEDEDALLLPPPGIDLREPEGAQPANRTYVVRGNQIIPLPARPRPAFAAARSEFGLDLGGAPSREAAKALWDYLKGGEAQFLAELQPLARNAGAAGEVRLILGPYADAADAAGACARLSRGGTACSTTTYAGEALP